MGNRSMFVGLDGNKETIDVSIAEGQREGEVRHYGVIRSDLEPLDKVVRALRAPEPTAIPLLLRTTLATACEEIRALEVNMRSVERQLAALAAQIADVTLLQTVP